jgi:hypothetical protein
MRQLVNGIIAPYFEAAKKKLNLRPSQVSIWKIDCWSVHKSREFLDWMKKHHPNIVILFVPGGCTGVWQPLDVGVQRLLKLSIKRSAHRDVVEEALQQIRAGKPPHEIKLDTTVGTLRDRSVGWVVQAIHDLDDVATITRVGSFTFNFCGIFNNFVIYRPSKCVESVTGTARTSPSPLLKLSTLCWSSALRIRHSTQH